MKVSVKLAVLISPDALRRNIRLSPPTSVTDIVPSFCRYLSPNDAPLTLRQTHSRDLALPKRNHGTLQDAFGIDASWIDADGLADIDLGAAFVNVPVKPKQRLVLLDDVHECLAARMGLHRQPHFVNHLQIPVEFGAGVERRAERRNVYIEYAPAHIGDLRKQLRELGSELRFGIFAFGVPRRRRRTAAIEHLIAAHELADLHLVEVETRRLRQNFIDLGEVVVTRNSDERNFRALQLLLGERRPFTHALQHEFLEQIDLRLGVGL